MTIEQEELLKRQQVEREREYAKQTDPCTVGAGSIGGVMGMTSGQPKQRGLLARIQDRRMQAAEASSALNQLQELEYLLEKNPSIARILELMDQVKVF